MNTFTNRVELDFAICIFMKDKFDAALHFFSLSRTA